MDAFDCLRCGACCCNPAENRAESYRDYIAVTPRDRELWSRPHLLRRYTVANAQGELHMKLIGEEQRCAALLGALGKHVECAIYGQRPRGCRRVEPGDKRCLQYRTERQIGV